MGADKTVFDFTVAANTGEQVSLSQFRGKALLIVNTASKCGFAPQYEGLERLHGRHADRGLVVLAFPCDQFAHQEPGSAEEIASFCKLNYGVTFPVMAKVAVKGMRADPLFEFLTRRAPGGLGRAVKWNFTKFLVAKDGLAVKRYAPATDPARLEADIEKALAS